VIEEFDIQGKVRYIVTDNASNMKKALDIMFYDLADTDNSQTVGGDCIDDPTLWEDIDGLQESLAAVGGRQLPCFVHSLQLVVRDGLASLSFARAALGKVSKLANLVHQSPLFRSSFEEQFGTTSSIPETNATRWNSVWMQLVAVTKLDSQKLQDLLKSSAHENLVFSMKDIQILKEVVDILALFAELTDLCQGQKTTTVSCVVPGILSLEQQLRDREQDVRHSSSFIHKLQKGT